MIRLYDLLLIFCLVAFLLNESEALHRIKRNPKDVRNSTQIAQDFVQMRTNDEVDCSLKKSGLMTRNEGNEVNLNTHKEYKNDHEKTPINKLSMHKNIKEETTQSLPANTPSAQQQQKFDENSGRKKSIFSYFMHEQKTPKKMEDHKEHNNIAQEEENAENVVVLDSSFQPISAGDNCFNYYINDRNFQRSLGSNIKKSPNKSQLHAHIKNKNHPIGDKIEILDLDNGISGRTFRKNILARSNNIFGNKSNKKAFSSVTKNTHDKRNPLKQNTDMEKYLERKSKLIHPGFFKISNPVAHDSGYLWKPHSSARYSPLETFLKLANVMMYRKDEDHISFPKNFNAKLATRSNGKNDPLEHENGNKMDYFISMIDVAPNNMHSLPNSIASTAMKFSKPTFINYSHKRDSPNDFTQTFNILKNAIDIFMANDGENKDGEIDLCPIHHKKRTENGGSGGVDEICEGDVQSEGSKNNLIQVCSCRFFKKK